MLRLLLTLGFGLLVAGSAFGGGGDFEDMPQQQAMIPQSKVVVVTPPADNTAIYVAAIAGVAGTLGAAYIGVRIKRN